MQAGEHHPTPFFKQNYVLTVKNIYQTFLLKIDSLLSVVVDIIDKI